MKNLAASGADGMSGAVAALSAELATIVWRSPAEVREFYPTAVVESGSIRIPISDGHCVDLIANYDTGMILIEFAGRLGEAAKFDKPKGRKPK